MRPMKYLCTLSKLKSNPEFPVGYKLKLKEGDLFLNSLLGQKIKIQFTGKIFCVHCQKVTKKSYSQGHCFPCSIKLAECDMCILKPENCHYFQGTCRDPSWGEEHCLQPHIIYLANSSGLKVGITRKTQIPYRWIDQGATSAIPLLEVKDRLTSGKIEVLFKKYINDKTDWRKMLKGANGEVSLVQEKQRLLGLLKSELEVFQPIYLEDEVYHFEYPVNVYPEKINSLTLDKKPLIESRLMGIKGQYLIFEEGVMNVRNHSGYEVEIEGE
jgi:hypothetical protein